MTRNRGALLAGCTAAGALILALAPRAERSQQAIESREQAYRFNNVGVARLEQFDYAKAADAFRRALELEPTLALARVNLSIALMYDSRLEDAEHEARSAGTALPAAPHPHYTLGLILRATDRSQAAAESFRRVLSLDPEDVGARIQLGQILTAERQFEEAVSLFGGALQREPFNATAAYGLATALARAGRDQAARAAMARFQQLRDNPAAVTYSTTYLGQGRYAEAMVSTGLEPELVDPAEPAVTFADATRAMFGDSEPAAAAAPAPQPFGAAVDRSTDAGAALDRMAPDLARSVSLADVDGDGDLDVIFTSGHSVVLRRNVRGRFDPRATILRIDGTTPIAAVAGDYDNDGRTDLFVVGYPASRLFHQEAGRAFRDVTVPAGIPASRTLARSAAFVDVDHDGDLDIFIAGLAEAAWQRGAERPRFPDSFAAGSNQLLRNNGNGRFSDVSSDARLTGAGGHGVAVVPTDFDNRRDIDLLLVPFGGAPLLFSNARDGTFRDVAAAVGLPPAGEYTAVAAGDVNKDGATDFFFGRAATAGLFAMSERSGRFTVTGAPEPTRDATAALFVDYDNDGLLDLLVLGAAGPRLWRNVGNTWSDVSARTVPGALVSTGDPPVAVATGDLDGDGDVDAVVRLASGRIRVWRNDGGNRHPSLRVRLTARVSNRSAVGSKVETAAGSLRQRVETSAATPMAAPADVLFGLGTRARADVVRVLWPAGILQAELDVPASAPQSSATMTIAELNRKPSSCPFLYTWNGDRFAFVTDFMGGGEMGAWEAPGERNAPDPDEYVRITGDQLRPRNGRFELRVTNELEEALFVDRLRLVAVTHASDVEVYPDEGLRSPAARRPFRLFTVRSPRPPRRATDDHGHDARDRLARLDGRYVDDFRLTPIQGYAEPHTLTLELDPPDARGRLVLLLTGWTDYAFSSDNVAAHQAGIAFVPPLLQMRDTAGAWKTVIPEIGLPVGRPQTVVADLTDALENRRLRSSPRRSPIEVRIVTTGRVYWDRILVDSSEPASVDMTELDPVDATLRSRGYSAEVASASGPPGYDYATVSTAPRWKTMPGEYTRFGVVRDLLTASDDRFVISAPGDEIALSFDAAALPPIQSGSTRTFLLYADGFSKEMNLHSSSPDRLGPLPFHGMSRYPYSLPERYPTTPAHERYRAEYNTRTVVGPLPSLESLLLPGHLDRSTR